MNWLANVPHCYFFGKPLLVLLNSSGNLIVGLAYMSIPISIELVRRARNMPFNNLAKLFTAFIAFCGMGHFIEIIAMFFGGVWWWVASINHLSTAAVSIFTAYYIWRLMPVLIHLPTPEEALENRRKLAVFEEGDKFTKMIETFDLPKRYE